MEIVGNTFFESQVVEILQKDQIYPAPFEYY